MEGWFGQRVHIHVCCPSSFFLFSLFLLPRTPLKFSINNFLQKLKVCLDSEFTSTFVLFLFLFSFFFFKPQLLTKSSMNSTFVHCSQTHKLHFSTTFSLKIDPTILFTHLKIILLQYFQFQFSVSVKISSIQTDPQLIISIGNVKMDIYPKKMSRWVKEKTWIKKNKTTYQK